MAIVALASGSIAVLGASPALAGATCTGGTTPALNTTTVCAFGGTTASITVPAGTTSVDVDLIGAGGGAGYPARQHIGGHAVEVTGTLALPAGTVYLYVIVGASGTGDNHGTSSGGGASAVLALDSGNELLAKLVIAGGGGGGAYNGDGGDGGSAGNSDNAQAVSGPGQAGVGATGGAGGTGNYSPGTPGGSDNPSVSTVAGGGTGGLLPGGARGGGGGGGYGGGGGGGGSTAGILSTNVAGGGGGSSLASEYLGSAVVSVKPGTGGVQLPGLVAGDGAGGSVTLTFNGVAAPGAPTAVSAVPGDSQASVLFTAPASDGGSAITGYTVTSSPGGATAACTASPCVVTGLTNATSYTFTVHATNANGNSVESSPSAAVTPALPPGAPTGVSAVRGAAQVSVSFTAPASNGGSAITGYTATASPGGLTATCVSSPCVVTGLTNGTSYTFTVHATNAIGDSAESAASSAVTPATIPGLPTAVSAAPGDGQASVSFTAPASTGGSAITGYTVTSAPGGLTATCVSSPCVVTGLTNGTGYTFTVHATNVVGNSTESSASASVTPAVVPGAPTGVSATASPGQASVSFSAPESNGGSTINGYTVTSTPGGLTASCVSSPCVITDLTNGTAYTFTVHATNAIGDSPESAVSIAVTPLSVPGAPTGVTASPADGEVSVAFTAPVSDGGSPITEYTVTSAPGGLTATCTASPCVVTGLTNGTAYTFSVTATNTLGDSASSASSASVTPATEPGAPTGVVATRGNGQVSVAFTAPDGDGGSAITGYTVTSAPGGLTATCVSSPCVVTGLTNGTSYTFTVHATNDVGDSAESATTTAVTPAAVPGAPTGVAAVRGNGQASVSFTAPDGDGGSAITGYTVTSAPGGLTATCVSSPCLITGLTNGTSYTFTVHATNDVGDSAESAATTAVTPATLSGRPTGVSATSGPGQATVAFSDPVSDGGSAITGYTVTSSPGGLTATCSSSPCVVTGLTNGTSYLFTVHATNGVGDSANSVPSAAITPSAPPAAPSSVILTPGDEQVTVSFDAPDDEGSAIFAYEYTVDGTTWFELVTAGTAPVIGVITGLVNGTTYPVQVRAINGAGTGAESTPDLVTPVTFPDAPANVEAVLGNGAAVVLFDTPISDGGTPITGYTVISAPSGITADCSGSPCNITGLTNGTSYTFTVHATNAVGDSTESSPSNAVIPARVPVAPGAVTVSRADSSAVLSFIAPSDEGGSAITSYEYTVDGSTWLPLTVTGTAPISATITGLVNGTTYPVQVRAVNSIGGGNPSPQVDVTPATSPGTPADVVAVGGPGQAVVSFAVPGSTGGSEITSYTVTAAPGGATASCAGSPCTVTGLTNGVEYTFTVHATNDVGDSTESPLSNTVTPLATPATIGAVTTTSVTTTTIGVSFIAPDDGGTPISGYEYSIDGGQTWATLSTTTNGTAITGTISSLVPGTPYSVTVRALNVVGTAGASDPVIATTPLAAVTAVAGLSSATITWTQSPDPSVTGYTVYAHPGPATCMTTSIDATSCVIGATAGIAYTYSVVAHSPSGDSPASPESEPVTAASVSVPLTAPLSAPTTLTTTDGILTSILPSQQITFLGTGFLPYSDVSIIIYSEPVVLGTALTDANGNFTQQVTMPAALSAGQHHLVASGVDPAGATRYLQMPVTVSSPLTITTPTTGATEPLAYTGTPAETLFTWAVMMLAAGVVFLRYGRRRRDSTESGADHQRMH